MLIACSALIIITISVVGVRRNNPAWMYLSLLCGTSFLSAFVLEFNLDLRQTGPSFSNHFPPNPAAFQAQFNYLLVCFIAAFGFAIGLLPSLLTNGHRANAATETHIISGVASGLPGYESHEVAFSKEARLALFKGRSSLDLVPTKLLDEMVKRNVVQLKKSRDGTTESCPVAEHSSCIQISASMGQIDLTRYGVTAAVAATMDLASQMAMAAGLEAMKEAGLVTGASGEKGWELPENLRATTAVIYACSFPALGATVDEVSRYHTSLHTNNASSEDLINEVVRRSKEAVSAEDLAALRRMVPESQAQQPYSFDRKFLFKALLLANSQLAQVTKARGPNVQTNAACAGTTQALSLAQDWLRLGRAERVVVIAGDNAAGDTLMPWLGSGFRALGAACISNDLVQAAQPFSPGRCGMILGSGAIGLVVERPTSYLTRMSIALSKPKSAVPQFIPRVCRLIETFTANSAFHGSSLDTDHIAQSMKDFLALVQARHGIFPHEIAKHGIYLSHETSTMSSPKASCAYNEVQALRLCFGPELLKQLLIVNTKGFTGHPMGVSFEDVVAVDALLTGSVPPVANLKESDPTLGALRLSQGGAYQAKYALRFAAGFGSQVALALYGLSGPV